MAVEVTDGLVNSLAQSFARKVGRKVKVFREDKPAFRKYPGAKMIGGSIRYILVVEGVNAHFGGMTINECKARLAMLMDLIYCGVFNGTGSQPGAEDGPTGASFSADVQSEQAEAGPAELAGQEPRSQVHLQRDDQSSDDNDRY